MNVAVAALKERLFALDQEAIDRLYGQSLLLSSEWALDDLRTLVAVAEAFEALDRRRIRTPLHAQELAYAVFFDDSTRTRSAWAGAAARLGMQTVMVDGSSTRIGRGETPEETGAMLGMNAHALGVRHDRILGQGHALQRGMLEGVRDYLQATNDDRQVPLVNLQCDVDHPTQALADLLWLKDTFSGELQGKKVAVTWACSPTAAKPLSVPQGLITLLPRFGMNVVLAHPEGYELSPECLRAAREGAEAGGGSFSVADGMDAAFEGAHAVYPNGWGARSLLLERSQASQAGDAAALEDVERRALEQNRRHADWICDERRMGLTQEALYMHCLPADPGAEVAPEVLRAAYPQLARQASKKVYVIMALLAGAKTKGLWGRLLELLD